MIILLSAVSVKLTKPDTATVLAIVIALPTSLGTVFRLIPTDDSIVILAVCGGLPIVANFIVERDLFAPSAFLGLGYLITIFGPALDIAAFNPDDRELLLGHNPEYLILPLLIVVIFTAAVMSGMVFVSGNQGTISSFRSKWNNHRAREVGIGLSLIGFVGFGLLLLLTGGIPTSLADLSSKRRPPTEYIRWMAQFLLFGSVILFADYLESSPGRRWSAGLLFTGSFVFAVFLPFYTSQRTMLLTFLISLLVIAHYRSKWVTTPKLVLAIPIGIFVSSVMLALRSGQERVLGDSAALFSLEMFWEFFEANEGGISAHAHLIHLVPDEIGYRYGQTLLKWIVYPIPRSFWPNKPQNLGQELGVLIYSQGEGIVGAGTPPFLAGELYLNFDVFGVVAGGLMLGLLVGWGSAYLRPTSGDEIVQIVLYTVFATQFVLGTMRGDFSPTVVGFLKWMVVMVPCITYIVHGFRESDEYDEEKAAGRPPDYG